MVALESVVQDRRPSDGLFVTAVTGCLDAEMRQMEYVSAGHPPPILLPSCRSTPLGGPPLGFAPLVPDHQVRSASLAGERAVLLVTDGLFEGFAHVDTRQRVGYDGLLELICAERRDAVGDPDFLTTLADRLETMNGGPLPDDAAALLLVRRSQV
jgi:serine phosphatase RsbU (regulator of sigma subunit)